MRKAEHAEGGAEFGTVRVWRMTRHAARVEFADPVLGGKAPITARRYCGPYMHANGAGLNVFSPVDVDLSYDPEREPRWIWDIRGEFFEDDDLIMMRQMNISHPRFETVRSKPRTKVYLPGLGDEPAHTAQIWTGCVFETPPGWALWIRSPVNREYRQPFRIQEAILETDWLVNDIWMNLEFIRWGQTARLRCDGPPIAQLIPVPRASYSHWRLEDKLLSPADPAAQAIFDRWVEFNWEKYHSLGNGKKDPGVYHRLRKRVRGRKK